MMKKNTGLKASCALLATLMGLSCLSAAAATDPIRVEKPGTGGDNTITIVNEENTGISIAGDWFHAYQIFDSDNLTTYAVNPNFINFFDEDGMTGGRGENFDFAKALTKIDNAKAAVDTDKGFDASTPEADKEAAYAADMGVKAAIADYNQLAGRYVESHQGDLYGLAVALREFIETDAASGDLIECDAHYQVPEGAAYPQTVKLEGLDNGYFFVLDEECDVPGLGIAASGAFVPLGDDIDTEDQTIKVKNTTPTVDKNILHNDEDGAVNLPGATTEDGIWDIVGDYQIGDTAHFLVQSTLPNNIEDYNFDGDATDNSYEDYYYMLTDTMSSGLSYNGDVKVFLDKDLTQLLDLNLYKATTDGNGFTLQVNVKALLSTTGLTKTSKLYTYYTGEVTSNAVVSKDYENNKIELEFSNNPSDKTHTGKDDDTVYSYTFDLAINKVDEGNNPLAGATFGIYEDGKLIPALNLKTVGDVDHYYLDADFTVDDTNTGLITTNATGKFVINGLDDKTTYLFKEVSAPDKYNPIDPFTFEITATYNKNTGMITTLTDNSDALANSPDNSGFEATIMNRKTVYLPTTGGTGTVMFQVGGGLLMCVAASYLLLNKRKKSQEDV